MPQALQLQAYLLESLQKLALVDPPRVRAVDAIAGSLAAVEVALPPAGRRGRPLAPESMQCRAVLHEVFKVLAPATGVLAASPDGLALLVRWASASDTPFDARLSETAAAMALFVGIQTLSFGAERLPPTLRNAHTTWVCVARSHPDDATAQSALLPALRGGAPGGGPDGSPAGHLFPVSGVAPAALVGPPRRWLLPAAVADRATGLGLAVADVIAVVDPPSWSYTLIPVAEYGHWPSAVPAATLERLGRHDGGRVLRVVVREHPPRVYGFGPDPDVEAFT
ncbi:hypothetical protein I4F81_005927 [Pyropia yezoensis]|uniref:Uncharacterized protein n=1 Tax=Pyropia yezoensis TaxID=2788 RepID=A0ACC3BZH8_PYRYE|nr:hypothetical protein I4F81_005927 [Neopyropia yezoensis]